ncbi:hypothetical protein ACFQU2_33370 [Siccirubricoccus deserti]
MPAPAAASPARRRSRARNSSGHMPGAANLPSSELLNADLTMKDPATLRALFEAEG